MREITVETKKYVAKDGEEFCNKYECERYDSCLTNLYEETIEALEDYNKSIEDVKYVKYKQSYTSIQQFLEVAKDIYYDSGYGSPKIRPILIVGFNWWLERGEYDGSEWWEYKEMPSREDTMKKDITKADIV